MRDEADVRLKTLTILETDTMPNRRDILKTGLVAGGLSLFPPTRALGQICTKEIDPATPVSPPTRPFIVPLPIPPVLQPVASLNPAPNASSFQRYNDFPPQLFYEISAQEIQWSFHPDLPLNTMWGYNSMIPGPTIMARYGVPILVRMHNNLPANHVGWGLPSLATHLHNLHTGSESDGFPADYTDVGYYRDHHYPNYYAGGDPSEMLSTLWYHDHRQDHTAENVTRGLTAFYLLFDNRDSGNENDTNPAALRLPSGKYDVPMVLHDRAFDSNGVQLFDLFNTDGIIGDKYTVNQVINPYFQVEPRKYRFRILNGGPSRFYQLFLSNGMQFIQITNDGDLLPAPIKVDSITLGVANRCDVVIDFSQVPFGSSFYLVNRMEQLSGRGPSGNLLTPGDQVMRFDVVLPLSAPDNSQVPGQLVPLPQIDLSKVAQQREWQFDYFNGSWLINGKVFDENRSDAQVQQGTSEIWTLRNMGTGWSHPIHIHFEQFRLLERNGKKIQPGTPEWSRKDTVILGPNDEVKLFIQFRDFTGRYVMHCHNVVHEDHSMMIRWDVV